MIGKAPMNKNSIRPGITKLVKGVPFNTSTDNFINAPSGDKNNIGPLIIPLIPITNNNKNNIQSANERDVCIFLVTIFIPFLFRVYKGFLKSYPVISTIIIFTTSGTAAFTALLIFPVTWSTL